MPSERVKAPAKKKRPKQRNRPFSLLIKPASADCNLRCSYCFYLEKHALYPETPVHRMSGDVLEDLVRSYMATSQPVYSFGWQGGEPTLMGTEFFRKVTELQRRYGRPGSKVANGLQTNGTLIDDELAEHLARFKFLVGVSIDGDKEIHDRYRTAVGAGGGSYDRVLAGIECLERHGVQFNGLVLVSRANIDAPERVYDHLKELGIRHHQYIPCVESAPDGSPLPWSIAGAEWGDFLVRLFDRWYPRDVPRVSIRNFDAVVNRLAGHPAALCSMGRSCSDYFVVEHNGDVYPCDFFVDPGRKLGNIRSDSLVDLRSSSTYRRFARRKSEWSSECGVCEYLSLCAGDCLKHRPGMGLPTASPAAEAAERGGTVSVLCEGWKRFYLMCLPRFEDIAEGFRG